MSRLKLIRAATVPTSLNIFCRGMLRELSQTYEVIALSSYGKELDQIAEREEVRTIGVNMERRISPYKDLASLIRLVRVFRKEKPDIVHSMTPKAGLLCMIAAWLTRVPLRIHTFTGLVFPTATGIKRHILMWTDKITCACATHIIPEGEGVKNDLVNFGITSKPIRVLGYGNVRGVDLDYFVPQHIPHNDFRFLYIGRIVRDKGINELVQAFVQLPDEAQLWLVGDIEPSDPVDAQTMQTIQQHPRIKLYESTEDVRPYYNQADCLVLPSYREGFPNVVLEAGAMQLPCLVTDINGSREIITNHINGLIVPSKDAEQLRLAMQYLLSHPQEAQAMGLSARPVIEQKFEQSFVRQCLYNYYKEIIHAV